MGGVACVGFSLLWVPSYVAWVCCCDRSYYWEGFVVESVPYFVEVGASVFGFRYGRSVVPYFDREYVFMWSFGDASSGLVGSSVFVEEE